MPKECNSRHTSAERENHSVVEAKQNQSAGARMEGSTKSSRSNGPTHKKLAESRWKKQSMSCYFGRRAGKPNANIRKRPIESAEAGKAETNRAVVTERPAPI